ncbi:MAG: hypothetical protein ACD_73C00791G0003 [uncultured bacterium]|nr:MAG: hypothetical protein ACD_73C00791G0003 [uncultured bacterium]
MKKNLLLCLILSTLFFIQCSSSSGGTDTADDTSGGSGNYRQDMRDFVVAISEYAKDQEANFIIIPQNGQDVIVEEDEEIDALGSAGEAYLAAIDGIGREDLNYGYDADDEATDADITDSINSFLAVYEENDVSVLVTDYTSTESKMDDSYAVNETNNYISFAANSRELDQIPDYPATPHNENAADVATLQDAQNFLYILNPTNGGFFPTKAAYLADLQATNYDALIIDLYYDEDALTSDEVETLKVKDNGGQRLVICYMSIGEAEDYRFYWDSSWAVGSPDWIAEENVDFPGNFKVQYWNNDWQSIIYGSAEAYLDKILEAGFDGVYLDLIDAYEYFEGL